MIIALALQGVVAFAALVVAFRMGETREAERQHVERDERSDRLYRGVKREAFGIEPIGGFMVPDFPVHPVHPLADPTFRLVAADDQTAIYLLLRGTP